MSVKVSAKLWRFLWALSLLNPTRSWNKYLRRDGLWTLKVDLNVGRKRDIKWDFNSRKEGNLSKWEITLFQEEAASGKKLLRYLSVRHLRSLNTWGKFTNTFLLGGNLSRRYCGVFSSRILWSCKIRRDKRRSDKCIGR